MSAGLAGTVPDQVSLSSRTTTSFSLSPTASKYLENPCCIKILICFYMLRNAADERTSKSE